MPIEPMTSPLAHFDDWFASATDSGLKDPNACALATADADGMPSVRMVLLKGHDERGFVFYTNLESDKSADLKANPKAAMGFYWPQLGRQIRIKGPVNPVGGDEADAYFATRPRQSQLGAWASDQSRPMAGRGDFERRLAEFGRTFEGRDVPRPPHWSGWRIEPVRVEFWQEGEFRLHERLVYLREGAGWRTEMLYP